MILKTKKDIDDKESELREVDYDNLPFYTLNKTSSLMKTDILENVDSYTILIDMPGFEKDEIKIVTESNYLEVFAKREDVQSSNYLHHERYYGTCYRKFYLGDGDKNNVKAVYKQGVLDLYIPKFKENTTINID